MNCKNCSKPKLEHFMKEGDGLTINEDGSQTLDMLKFLVPKPRLYCADGKLYKPSDSV